MVSGGGSLICYYVKKKQWKKLKSTGNTQGILSVSDYDNPEIVILKEYLKYPFCNDFSFHNIVGLPF